jgi:A/G-specific adenine glycosylase
LKKLIIKGMDKRYFSKKIVEWYLENKRDLPWRHTNDPYKIWLSEIILQQTRVAQGLPYYQSFIHHYPTVRELAKAPEQQVLRHWQGLGYYTRARNLHKCARYLVDNHQGQFPKNFSALKLLPGVGEYTAAAIASFCYQEPVAVVDGNVFRVLSRVFGLDTAINSPAGKKQFNELAGQLIDKTQPHIHNQAIMEFGATLCTPKNPACENCPLNKSCFAKLNGLRDSLPVKQPKVKSRHRYFYYLVHRRKDKIHMKKRESKDIWTGLYDFPLIERAKPLSEKKIVTEMASVFNLDPENCEVTTVYKHVLTHQRIFCRFVVLNDDKTTENRTGKFYSRTAVLNLPKPVLISRFLNDYAFLSMV